MNKENVVFVSESVPKNISVIGKGQEKFFRVIETAALKELFDKFCDAVNMDVNSVYFSYKGYLVSGEDTLLSIGVKEYDHLLCEGKKNAAEIGLSNEREWGVLIPKGLVFYIAQLMDSKSYTLNRIPLLINPVEVKTVKTERKGKYEWMVITDPGDGFYKPTFGKNITGIDFQCNQGDKSFLINCLTGEHQAPDLVDIVHAYMNAHGRKLILLDCDEGTSGWRHKKWTFTDKTGLRLSSSNPLVNKFQETIEQFQTSKGLIVHCTDLMGTFKSMVGDFKKRHCHVFGGEDIATSASSTSSSSSVVSSFGSSSSSSPPSPIQMAREQIKQLGPLNEDEDIADEEEDEEEDADADNGAEDEEDD